MYPPPIDPSQQQPFPDPMLPPDAPPIVPGDAPPPVGDQQQEPPDQEEKDPEDVYGKDVLDALLRIKDKLCVPERTVREAFVRKLKKLECYWNNLQYIYWDAIARDYRDYQDRSSQAFEDPQADTDVQAIAKVINIYKAHGQAWISAIAAGIPFVRFFPDDADNPSDVETAKAYSKISELIQRHNQADVFFLRALYLLYNTGVVFAYNERKTSKDFGTTKVPIPGQQSVTNRSYFCPSCGAPQGQETVTDPNAPPKPPQTCPNCGLTLPPESQDQQETFPTIVGYDDKPKSREILACFGPLHVEVPHYISKLDDTPYLRFVTEEPIGKIQETYPEFAHLIKPSYDTDAIERWARNDRRYNGEWQENICTVQRMWLRPWAFNYYGGFNDAIVKQLKVQYPDGLYMVIINDDLIVEVVQDKLDEHWTATLSPFSEHIHSEPEGASLVPVQDMTNELANITLETIEFGIPETFADPSVLDFENYSKSEARPGMVNQAKAPSGQNLSAGFHDIKAASLSQEVEMFADRLDGVAQFVLGTFPTIYGGQLEGGSGTAREYELSRAQALQRLSGTWTVLKSWWSKVMAKAVKSYADNMTEDEKMVKNQGDSFINVWIRKSQLQGTVGEIEPETSEAFPISWAQKRDVLLQLINMKDPQVGEILMHPENASFVAELIGMPDLYIPGDDSRNKQLYEIATMLQGQPTVMGVDPMSGQEQFQSSVPVDPEVDNHGIEAEVCLAWLNGDVGLATKEQNPAAWMNVRAHFMEHNQIIQMQQAQQMQLQAMQADQKNQQKSQGPPKESKSDQQGPGDVSNPNPEPQAQSA
jgi:hypothetical protein